MTLTASLPTAARPLPSISARPARCRAASAATRSRSPPSSPARSASARSRSPTTSARVTRESIEAGPKSIWRYRQLLPVPSDVQEHPNTEPGLTRLIKADRLGAALGLRNLWVKDDTGNPTHSFKDRVVAVALAAARELGFSRARAARPPATWPTPWPPPRPAPGWDSVVLIPSSLEQAKVLTTAVYDGTLLAVDGNYDDVNRLATELAAEHEDWAFVNVNVRPYYAEGSKTLGYEVAEQLGWRLPEQVVVPVASGSQLTKVDKGFTELGDARAGGAHARTGCSARRPPAARRWPGVRGRPRRGAARCGRTPSPARWPSATPPTARTCSTPCAAPAARSRTSATPRWWTGIRLLARTEGVFAETAGGVTVATTREAGASGQLDPDAETVLLITGDGLKTLDAVAGQIGPTATVPATSKAVREALAGRGV